MIPQTMCSRVAICGHAAGVVWSHEHAEVSLMDNTLAKMTKVCGIIISRWYKFWDQICKLVMCYGTKLADYSASSILISISWKRCQW